MQRKHGRRRGRGDRGAAMVEFAFILIPLLLILLGIICFGYMFGQKLILNNAVREGARAAVVEGGSADNGNAPGVDINVRNAVDGMIPDAMSNDDLTIEATGPNGSTGTLCTGSLNTTTGEYGDVTVTATYKAKFLTGMPIPGFPDGLTLTSKAVYKCEFS